MTVASKQLQFSHAELGKVGIAFQNETSVAEWEEVGQFIAQVEGAVQWWIGDWLNYGEGRPKWGDKYEAAVERFGLKQKTLEDYKAVASRFQFPERSGKLPWSHHQAIAYEPPAIRKELLQEAADSELSVSQLKKEAKHRRQGRDTPSLPRGKYRVLYADPPWKYADERMGTKEAGAASAQYDLLDTEVICSLASGGRCIQQLPAKDSVLFLWATAPVLPDALRVMAAWGFTYKAQFIWDKVQGYNGHYNDVKHELLLIGIRGQCQPAEGKLEDSIIREKKTQHSAKPGRFYTIMETMYPIGKQSHIELFARKQRKGWDVWGKEISTTDMIGT